MDRRKFLKWGSFLTVSTATLGLAACGSDDDDDAGGGGAGGDNTPYTFPQGIASGDPRADSIVLWTRIGGAVDGRPVSVTVQLSEDEAFSSLLVDATVDAEADWDYTVRHKVQGLEAGKAYYYRFAAGSGASVVGRTRTAPGGSASPSQLKFAFISCQDWSVNHWAAFDELLRQDLDFIVHLGDYVYETVSADFQSGAVESAHGALTLPDGTARSDGAFYATTLADYRYLYKQYRSDPRLQALHARFPFIAIWDDHEFSDDAWRDRQTYEVGDDAQEQSSRRRDASQAWFEFMPADVSFDLSNPSFDNIQIYRAFQFGDLATLVMTDERLYRADHIIEESLVGSEIGSRYFVPTDTLQQIEAGKIAAAGGNLAEVSMLGDTQRGWWKNQMRESGAIWKLWGNEVSLLRMGFDGAGAVAGLAARQLAQQLAPMVGGSVPDALVLAMQQALAADLAAADVSSGYPVSNYDNLAAVLGQLGISPEVFAAAIKPGIDAVASQIPAALLGRYVLNADQWDGYNAERKDLMAHLRDNGITNVVALTGDIHSFYAGSVMADYDADAPQPVMVDLVTAGISSNSFFSYFKSVVDAPGGAFAAARDLIYQTGADGEIINTFNDTLTQFNGDWIRYAETDAQGFAVVTLTRDALHCTFSHLKPLDDGDVPALPAVAREVRLVVDSGTPAVKVLES